MTDEEIDKDIDEYNANLEAKVLMYDGINIILPKCCIEGRDDCKHVVQKQRPDKRNIGL